MILGIDAVRLTDNQYSYQHVKAFGINNHLILDEWNTNTVYFVDTNWKVLKVAVQLVS